jgi:hypothetical protein
VFIEHAYISINPTERIKIVDNLDLRQLSDRERHKDLIAQSAEYRLYKELHKNQVPLSRRVARYIGQQIFDLSLTLLRYGKTDLKAFFQCYKPLLEQQEQ